MQAIEASEGCPFYPRGKAEPTPSGMEEVEKLCGLWDV